MKIGWIKRPSRSPSAPGRFVLQSRHIIMPRKHQTMHQTKQTPKLVNTQIQSNTMMETAYDVNHLPWSQTYSFGNVLTLELHCTRVTPEIDEWKKVGFSYWPAMIELLFWGMRIDKNRIESIWISDLSSVLWMLLTPHVFFERLKHLKAQSEDGQPAASVCRTTAKQKRCCPKQLQRWWQMSCSSGCWDFWFWCDLSLSKYTIHSCCVLSSDHVSVVVLSSVQLYTEHIEWINGASRADYAAILSSQV